MKRISIKICCDKLSRLLCSSIFLQIYDTLHIYAAKNEGFQNGIEKIKFDYCPFCGKKIEICKETVL